MMTMDEERFSASSLFMAGISSFSFFWSLV